MTTKIPKKLRAEVRRRANQRCEYCQTPELLVGSEHEIDHIIPRSHKGPTTSQNLCLACASCNGYKHAKMYGRDPETDQEYPLFHPRLQPWHEHFTWNEDGSHIIGLTPYGRATIIALHLNHALIVKTRAIWVQFGYHPPSLPDTD
jgi:hypothetical protein